MYLKSEYLHSSVLRFCPLEPYVPLRNATKRKRLRFWIYLLNSYVDFGWGLNSNGLATRTISYVVIAEKLVYNGYHIFGYILRDKRTGYDI
jgi:hypothetical protein